MLADIVSQSRAAAVNGGCTGSSGPSLLLPSYSRAYDVSLSVTKWGQSSGDGADKQEEIKRQKRELMRAAREAAREASAAAAAAASVAAAAAEAAADNTVGQGVVRTEGNKGRATGGVGDGLVRDERKRKRDAAGISVVRMDGGVGQLKREDAFAGAGTADAGSDDELKVVARVGESATTVFHQRGGAGTDDVDVRFIDLPEEKAAVLDAQGAVKIEGLVMWEALAGASQSLLQHRKSGYFLEPVDPVALGLDDYRDVVKEPSDLGTVCSRVQRQGFETLQQWVRDIDLIWANALLYNPSDHPVHKDADQMRLYWRNTTLKRVAKVLPFPVSGCVSSSDSRHRVLLNWSSRLEREVAMSIKQEGDESA